MPQALVGIDIVLSNCPNCGLTMPKFSLTCPICGYKARLSQPLIGSASAKPFAKLKEAAPSNATESTSTPKVKNRCLACGASVDPQKIKCWKCGNSLVSVAVAKKDNLTDQIHPPTRNSMKDVKRENRKRKFLRAIKKLKFSI